MKTLSHWLSKLPHVAEFIAFYLWEVLISNFRVARDVLMPSDRMKPDFIRVNVEGLTERQLLATANLISMTPGTLSIDVDHEKGELIVHSLYVSDKEQAAKELEQIFKKRISRVF